MTCMEAILRVMFLHILTVAPRAGAWIETSSCVHQVAPRAGAWIETLDSSTVTYSSVVAPRAGAWIETKAD